MDFIGKHGLCVSSKARTVTSVVGCAEFIFLPTHVVKKIKLRSKSVVIIPPNSIAFVKAKAANEGRIVHHGACLLRRQCVTVRQGRSQYVF